MDYAKRSLELHREWNGKLETIPKMEIKSKDDLSLAYTPGVARPCEVIRDDIAQSFNLTWRKNTVAVVTDGSAVLGLGDIGAVAGLPVMEGKCVLFKSFGGVDAVPICLDTRDPDKIVEAVAMMACTFGGINLEDISAPRCFEIEEKLKARCDIPIFHDDQHGTAIVVLAGITNALRCVGKRAEDVKAVISGAGAAGTAIARLLVATGMRNVIVCDRTGAIAKGDARLNAAKASLAEVTNPNGERGKLAEVIRGADIFLGVSAPGLLTQDMIRSMAKDPIVFAMANPIPEIMPEEAKAAGAAIVGTGRSDYPNQINNVLAFPGVFRGALDAGAKEINEEMKLAAARALADLAADGGPEKLLPKPFDPGVGEAVAKAVAKAARDTGVCRTPTE
ncbi:MAG: NADP-dependent malic enzyme [Oscillospiraceae bacterium]|nr:NADP-dependent malic enzyme [Oscillospiraceae bacterium]